MLKATLIKWRKRHDTCLRADRGALPQMDWPSFKAAQQGAARRKVSPKRLILTETGSAQKARQSHRAARQGHQPSLRLAARLANLLNAMTVVPLDQRCLKPSRSLLSSIPVAFVIGAVLAFVMVPVVARTSAIAAPEAFFVWFRSHGLVELAAFSWDALVVYGLSIAVPAAALLVLLFRMFPGFRVVSAISFSVAVLISLHCFVPLYWGEPVHSPFGRAWWQHGLVAALLMASGIALGISCMLGVTVGSSGAAVPPDSGARPRR